MRVLTGHKAVAAEVVDPATHCDVAGTEGPTDPRAVRHAAGRGRPQAAHRRLLGLEELGIRTGAKGTVETNAYLQTLHPNIYACGDVAGPGSSPTQPHTRRGMPRSTRCSAPPGTGFARIRPSCRRSPHTEPEVGRVGLNEREARAQNVAYEVTHHDLGELYRAIVYNARAGFAKVLTAPGKDRILGATIVAPRAGEMLAGVRPRDAPRHRTEAAVQPGARLPHLHARGQPRRRWRVAAGSYAGAAASLASAFPHLAARASSMAVGGGLSHRLASPSL